MKASCFATVAQVLLLIALAGCQADKPEFAKVKIGDKIDSLVGSKVEIKGYLFDKAEKGFPRLYENASRQTFVVLAFPGGLNDENRNQYLGRQLMVRGTIEKLEPIKVKKGEPVPQQYGETVYPLRVQSVEIVK